MLKLLAGAGWVIVGWFCVAFFQLLLGIACVVDAGLKALNRGVDWLLLAFLRCWPRIF